MPTYQRIVVKTPGGPDALEVITEEIPAPEPDEIRVRVQAAGVARPDVYFRTGVMVPPDIYPMTPGYDVAGIVDAVGAEVTRFEVGQAVAGVTGGAGGYAEVLCHKAFNFVPLPEGVDPADAVCVGLNGVMAYQMLHRKAHAQAGEAILIHGAAGGIGHIMAQLGKLAGLTVYGTASTTKQATLHALGVESIDYTTEDFVERVKALTTDGVDVVLDGIGGNAQWDRSFQCLRFGGRLVVYGYMSIIPQGVPDQARMDETMQHSIDWNMMKLWGECISIEPYSFAAQRWHHREQYREDLGRLLSLVAEGSLKPLVGAMLPLSQAAQAHELLNASAVAGKIVLVS
jgi:NADPH2:quinone reductase